MARQAEKVLFKNLETVYFNYVGKDIIYEDDDYFKDKQFFIPNSINHKSIKELSITNSPYQFEWYKNIWKFRKSNDFKSFRWK